MRLKFKERYEADKQILEVNILDASDVIARAEEIAHLKANRVQEDDPSGRRRSYEEKLSQNFLGALADIACTHLLRAYFEKYDYQIEVENYDEIRTDNFELRDQFDIRLRSHKCEATVEVRSSVCVKKSLPGLIKDWHILGPYSSQVKGDTETIKEFYIRPMYHLRRYRENYQENFYHRNNGMDLVKRGEIDLYILGGATEHLMNSSKAWDEHGDTLKQGQSNFRVVFISDGLSPKDILEEIVREML